MVINRRAGGGGSKQMHTELVQGGGQPQLMRLGEHNPNFKKNGSWRGSLQNVCLLKAVRGQVFRRCLP